MEKLSVRTEYRGFYIARNDGLKFKMGEISVDIFYLKYLAVVKTMKQTKRDRVYHQVM